MAAAAQPLTDTEVLAQVGVGRVRPRGGGAVTGQGGDSPSCTVLCCALRGECRSCGILGVMMMRRSAQVAVGRSYAALRRLPCSNHNNVHAVPPL